MFFSATCYTIQKTKVKAVEAWRGKNVEVLGVVTKSGETVEFPEKHPSRIFDDGIIGKEKMTLEIDRSRVKKIIRNGEDKILQVITQGGKSHFPVSTKEQEDKIICTVYKLIPLAEIDMIFVKKLNSGSTFLALIIGAGVGIYLLGLIMFKLGGGPSINLY